MQKARTWPDRGGSRRCSPESRRGGRALALRGVEAVGDSIQSSGRGERDARARSRLFSVRQLEQLHHDELLPSCSPTSWMCSVRVVDRTRRRALSRRNRSSARGWRPIGGQELSGPGGRGGLLGAVDHTHQPAAKPLENPGMADYGTIRQTDFYRGQAQQASPPPPAPSSQPKAPSF